MSIVLIIIGTIILLLGITVKRKYSIDLKRSHMLHAEITDIHLKTMEGKNRKRFYPVVKFKWQGTEYKQEYCFGTKKERYHIGDKVEILFDSNDKMFYIAGDNVENRLVAALFGIALLLYAMAVLIIIF